MKKIQLHDKIKRRKRSETYNIKKIEHSEQLCCLNKIFLTEPLELRELYIKEIKHKLSNYQRQDNNKWCIFELHNGISYDELIELLVASKLSCSYCRHSVYILYECTKDKEQWTLDRIDNTLPHTRENCVISCLACNLQKRTNSDTAFRFTKQLRITKQDI